MYRCKNILACIPKHSLLAASKTKTQINSLKQWWLTASLPQQSQLKSSPWSLFDLRSESRLRLDSLRGLHIPLDVETRPENKLSLVESSPKTLVEVPTNPIHKTPSFSERLESGLMTVVSIPLPLINISESSLEDDNAR